MDRQSQDLSNSKKFRYIIIYLAVATTLAVLGSGWNQHAVCATQKDNVKTTNLRNHALDKIIDEQVKLYTVVDNITDSKDLKIALDSSILNLENSRSIIREATPSQVQCLIVGNVNVSKALEEIK